MSDYTKKDFLDVLFTFFRDVGMPCIFLKEGSLGFTGPISDARSNAKSFNYCGASKLRESLPEMLGGKAMGHG